MDNHTLRIGSGWPILGAVLGVLWAAEAAPAQSDFALCEDDAPEQTLRSASPTVPENVCASPPSSFRLFGNADFAGSSMRSAATDVFYWTTSTGFSDSGRELLGETLPFGVRGTAQNPSAFSWQNFEIQFWAAAARGDWLRNREIQTSLENVSGGGWTYIANLQRLAGFHQWAGHDGTVGFLHSGVQATAGAGCLDHGGGYPEFPYGFPLLASFDCPETWGSAGWEGRGWIGPGDNWLDYFEDVGPSNFSFDFWRVPQSYWSAEPTIGDFQVFGVMSDHGREYGARYGAVIPGQSGDPELEGYPIGLDVHFNAFSFKIPSVSRGFIWEGLIINNSAEVYGVPLDYDSLFFGMTIRPLRDGVGIGGGRRANPHAIPELGAIAHNELGRTPDCDGALPVPESISCSSPRARTPGFSGGAQGHIIFKSPIGDLRNKHFTNPASPFYAPGHPNAGDTITFNRMSMCDFRCLVQQFIFDARKGYGILAANPAAALDGRDPRELSDFERWGLFKGQFFAPDGSELFCDPTQPREPGCFGYRVPGDWAYTNRPPGTPLGPDTLFIDNCRPPTSPHPGANQCTALWADTLPDRILNWTQNVIWPGAGPFPLKAGDTTAFVVVTFAAPDSAGLMASLDAFLGFYMEDFYLGPGLPAPPNIVSVQTTSGSARLGQTSITLFLDDAAEQWRDPFALKTLAELRDPKPGTFLYQVVQADPDAADKLEALINRTNVDSVYLYKSCDGGRSFTADRSGWECEPSPSQNTLGEAVGTGWQAYTVFTPDAQGVFPTTFRDRQSVAPGRSYIYSLLAHTPGIHLETAFWDDADGDGVMTGDEVRDTTLTVVPEGRSLLSTNVGEPFVVNVYVPASAQAGAEAARVQLVSRTGPVPFRDEQVNVVFVQDAESQGRFRLVFGADATATEYRSPPEGGVDSTVVRLARTVRALMPDGSLQELESDTVEYRSTLAAGILLATGSAATVTTTTVEDTIITGSDTTLVVTEITETDFNAKTGILLDGGGAPLFVSSRLSAGQFTPPRFLVHPTFQQFIVDVDDSPGRYVTDFWAVDGEPLRSRSAPSVDWSRGSSISTDLQFGVYVIDWGAPAFGGTVFVDIFNPLATAQAYADLLNARAVVTRAETGDEIAAAIARDVDPTVTTDDLVGVKLPFTVRNLAFGQEGVGTPVRIAMLAESKLSTALLGNAPDSATVPVPADVWIPGEPLVFLEEIALAQTDGDGNLVRDPNGQPVFTTQLRVTWSDASVACGPPEPRPTCNPVSGPRRAGAPGYVEVRPNGSPGYPNGWDLWAVYKNAFTSQSSFDFDVFPTKVGTAVTKVTPQALDSVKVVPNPYIGRSAYELEGNVRRLMFTHLPPTGSLQIFTASGQFIQRIRWETSDLAGNGDLFWDMQTREGNLIASGLYLFVVEARDPTTGQSLKKIGRFIVIR